MIEVEIKVRISDPSRIRKKFAEFNGVYKLSLHHEDIYFNMPMGLRDFLFILLNYFSFLQCDNMFDLPNLSKSVLLNFKLDSVRLKESL